jgi:excisionase family DNA binding protein
MEMNSKMTNQTKLVTVKELSNYLRVHPSTIYRLLKEGELPGFKLGSDWRFNLETIHRWRADQAEEMEKNRPEDRN